MIDEAQEKQRRLKRKKSTREKKSVRVNERAAERAQKLDGELDVLSVVRA